MSEWQKEALETLRNLSLQVMLISAGVFGVVGGFLTASEKVFIGPSLVIWALLAFTLSGLLGYLLHGAIIGFLNKERFDPHNIAIQGCALAQVMLFICGGVLFIIFVSRNV